MRVLPLTEELLRSYLKEVSRLGLRPGYEVWSRYDEDLGSVKLSSDEVENLEGFVKEHRRYIDHVTLVNARKNEILIVVDFYKGRIVDYR